MPTPDTAGKPMSSRLLTMKFMQRAAASSPTASPKGSSEHPSKKQRLSSDYSPVNESADAQALRDVLAAEELKREQAIERQGADKGETKWVLSTRTQPTAPTHTPMRIVTAGYSMIDSSASNRMIMENNEDEEEDGIKRPAIHGRRSFGKFNRAIERMQNPDLSSSSEDENSDDSKDESGADSDDDEDDQDDPTGTNAMIAQSRKEAAEKARAERKARKKADKAELTRLAAERRTKEVNLNASGRISGGGGTSPSTANITCHECGQKGHVRAKCPELRGQKSKKRGPPR